MIFQIDWEQVSLTATKSIFSISAAANRPVFIRELCIGFDGVTAAQVPIEVQILRASDAGTGSARTPVTCDPRDASAVQASALTVMTVEPTYTINLMRFFLHAQTPPLIWQPPERIWKGIAGSSFMGLRVVSASISPAVKSTGYITLEE